MPQPHRAVSGKGEGSRTVVGNSSGSARAVLKGQVDPTRVLAVLAGVLAVLFLVVLGFRVFDGGSDQGPPAAMVGQQDIVEAAQSVTTAFLDVDYADMVPRMAKVLSLATGTFYDRYKAAQDELRRVTAEGEVRSAGTVRYVGLSTVGPKTATAYVAADSTVTNSKTAGIDPTGAAGEKRHYRFRVELKLVKGAWLVSDLEFVR